MKRLTFNNVEETIVKTPQSYYMTRTEKKTNTVLWLLLFLVNKFDCLDLEVYYIKLRVINYLFNSSENHRDIFKVNHTLEEIKVKHLSPKSQKL